ncbi:hypothetical protein MSPP1_000715 [Malassezia sp. CBS 17886]|nr:hypothetical protein MSPP1_000715 [Malassezia sp. CBS 17886]
MGGISGAVPQTTTAGNTTAHLPMVIVPARVSTTGRVDWVLVSILFKKSMPWSWIAKQRATTAQIFTYLPQVLGAAMNTTAEDVHTLQLKAYTPRGETTAQTLYQAYVPRTKVGALQKAVSTRPSPFWEPPIGGVAQRLMQQVDPAFNLMSYANDKQSNDNSKGLSTTARDALIGVFSSVGGLTLIALAVWLVVRRRKTHAKQEPATAASRVGRRGTIQSFSGLGTTPQLRSHNLGPAAGSYYIGDQTTGPYITAFEPPHGVTGTVDLNADRRYDLAPTVPPGERPPEPPHSAVGTMPSIQSLQTVSDGKTPPSSSWQECPWPHYDTIPHVQSVYAAHAREGDMPSPRDAPTRSTDGP